MKKRGNVWKTSWSITYFWVFLSFILSFTATYSFVQVEWIISKMVVSIGSSNLPNYRRPNDTEVEDRQWLSSVPILNDPVTEGPLYPIQTVNIGVFGYCITSSNFFYDIHESCHIAVTGTGSNPQDTVSLSDTHAFGKSFWFFIAALTPPLAGGLGCLTLALSAVFSTSVIALPTSKLRRETAVRIGRLQVIAVLLLFLTLLTFSMRFAVGSMKPFCDGERPYNIIFGKGRVILTNLNRDSDILSTCELGWAYALFIVSAALSLYCPFLSHFTHISKAQHFHNNTVNLCMVL